MRSFVRNLSFWIAGTSLILSSCAPAAQPVPAPAAPKQPQAPAPAAAPQAPAALTAAPQAVGQSAPLPKPTGIPRYGGRLKTFLIGTGEHLDPIETATAFIQRRVALIFSQLVRIDTSVECGYYCSKIIPGLAESWKISDDGRTYTFNLRKGVKWQNVPPVNGREFTSEDVKFSIERMKTDPFFAFAQWFAGVEEIQLPDKYTVVVKLKQPYTAFITVLGAGRAWIHPKEVVETDGNLRKRAIGTGPFILRSYELRGTFTYEKNLEYFEKGLPYLDGIDLFYIGDSAAAKAAMMTQAVDLGEADTSLDFNAVKKAIPGANGVAVLGTSHCGLFGRTDKPEFPFSKLKVRQALSMSVDRKAMAMALDFPESVPMGPLSPAWGDVALPVEKLGEGAQYYEYNPEKAKRFLAEAGYPKGFKTRIEGSLVPTLRAAGEVFITYLKDLGMDATFRFDDQTIFIAGAWSGKYEEMGAGCPGGGEGAASDDLYLLYRSTSNKNISHVRDPKLDDMLDKQNGMLDGSERVQLLQEIQRYLAVQQYYIWLPVRVTYTVWGPQVKNWRPGAVGPSTVGYSHLWLER